MAKSLKDMRATLCGKHLDRLRATHAETRRNPCGRCGRSCGQHTPFYIPLERGRGNYGIPLPLFWFASTSAEPLANPFPMTSGPAALVPSRLIPIARNYDL